jgi:hypothetical protein
MGYSVWVDIDVLNEPDDIPDDETDWTKVFDFTYGQTERLLNASRANKDFWFLLRYGTRYEDTKVNEDKIRYYSDHSRVVLNESTKKELNELMELISEEFRPIVICINSLNKNNIIITVT